MKKGITILACILCSFNSCIKDYEIHTPPNSVSGETTSISRTIFLKAMDFAQTQYTYCHVVEKDSNITFIKDHILRVDDSADIWNRFNADRIGRSAVVKIYDDILQDTNFLKSHFLEFQFTIFPKDGIRLRTVSIINSLSYYLK